MRRIFPYPLFFFTFFVLIQWGFPQILTAHGTGYRVLSENTAITAEFYYSNGEPMNYAEVFVFSPQNEKTEYQNGRTDRKGRFAFHPDIPGTWRVEVSDGMGHKVQGTVEVKAIESREAGSEGRLTAENKHSAARSNLMGTVLGLSLIFNLCFILFFWKKKTHTRGNSRM